MDITLSARGDPGRTAALVVREGVEHTASPGVRLDVDLGRAGDRRALRETEDLVGRFTRIDRGEHFADRGDGQAAEVEHRAHELETPHVVPRP